MKCQRRQVSKDMKYKISPLLMTTIIVFVWCSVSSGFMPLRIAQSLPDLRDLLTHMFPPNWAYSKEMIIPLIQTAQIALLGMLSGYLLSTLLGVISIPSPQGKMAGFYRVAQNSLKALFKLPLVVLSVIVLAATGNASLAGVATIGVWACLLIQRQGLNTTGLSRMAPAALRSTIVLGLLGMPGIGFSLIQETHWRAYSQVSVILMTLLLGLYLLDWGFVKLARFYTSEPAPGTKLVLLVSTIVLIQWSLGWQQVGMGFWDLLRIVPRLLPRDLTQLVRMALGLMESFNMAIAGSLLGGLMAVPVALFTIHKSPLLRAAGRFTGNLMRFFPAILLAVLIMPGTGSGAFCGVLAIGIHTTGVLGDLFSKVIPTDRIGGKRLELGRLLSVSADVLPGNLRTATIMGLVGAGGIGQLLKINLSYQVWPNVLLIMLGITSLLAVTDWGIPLLKESLLANE
jgi:phosphonate transport system permease protein